MTIALHHAPTKTEMEAIERRRKFREHIQEMAIRANSSNAPVVPIFRPRSAFDQSQYECMWFYDLIWPRQQIKPPPKIEAVKGLVCEYFSLDKAEIESTSRYRTISRPRMIAMYLCYLLTRKSFADIGRKFGNRDHSTVVHAFQKVRALLESDSELQVIIAILREKLA